jgi:hypothetical protein
MSKTDPRIQKLFSHINKTWLILSIGHAEKFLCNTKKAINAHSAIELRDAFARSILPERVNKIKMCQTLLDHAYSKTSNTMICVELILGFQLSIEAFTSDLILKFLMVMSSKYGDLSAQLQKDIEAIGIRYGKDFRSIGIDFDWIQKLKALENSINPLGTLLSLETQLCGYAKAWLSVTGEDLTLQIESLCAKLRHKDFSASSLKKFKSAVTELFAVQSVEVLKTYARQKDVILSCMMQHKSLIISEFQSRFRLGVPDVFGKLTAREKRPVLATTTPSRSSKRQRS